MSTEAQKHVRILLDIIEDTSGDVVTWAPYAQKIAAARAWLSGLDPERPSGAPETGSGAAPGDGGR